MPQVKNIQETVVYQSKKFKWLTQTSFVTVEKNSDDSLSVIRHDQHNHTGDFEKLVVIKSKNLPAVKGQTAYLAALFYSRELKFGGNISDAGKAVRGEIVTPVVINNLNDLRQ